MLTEQEWRDNHVKWVATVVYSMDHRLIANSWLSRGITLNLDGSNKERCRLGIKGLRTNFEPPLPEVDRKILGDENSSEFVTMKPDLDVLDAQGRPEDRAAMLSGAKASDIAASRQRCKGRTNPEYIEDLKVEENTSGTFTVGDVRRTKWNKF